MLRLLVFVVCSAAVQGVPAAAQTPETFALMNRVNQLEQQVQTLSRQVYRGGQGPVVPIAPGSPAGGGVAADLEVRLTRLETQLRDLTGQIERQGFQLNQATARLDKLSSDVDFRLSQVERGSSGGSAPPGSADLSQVPAQTPRGQVAPSTQTGQMPPGAQTRGPPMQVPPPLPPASGGSRQTATALTAPAPGGTLGTINPNDLGGQGQGRSGPPGANAPPEAMYNYAFGLLEVQDYGKAEEAFRAFLAKNPNHPLSGNAQYWLAETYYARRDLERAAAAFAEGYQKYPTGAKAADNLLKLGVTLAQLGRTKDACITFAEMEKQFANAPANLLRYAERQRSQLRC